MRGIPRSLGVPPSDKCREVIAMPVPRFATLAAFVVLSLAAHAFQGPPIIIGGGNHPSKGAKNADTAGTGGTGAVPPHTSPDSAGASRAPATPPSVAATQPAVAPTLPLPWIPTPLNLATESDDGWVLWWEYNK